MKVGIIGAGTMGSGIAQAFAMTEGYEVSFVILRKNTHRQALQRFKRTSISL